VTQRVRRAEAFDRELDDRCRRCDDAFAGSSRRTSSIICRSVPPGSKLVITIATGTADDGTRAI